MLVSVDEVLLDISVQAGQAHFCLLSFLGLVLTNTTDLLSCFIGRDNNLYTASCALTSLCVRKPEPTFLIWLFNPSAIASDATRFSNTPMAL